jgi:prepilin-type N-terminal cleavage/methylation domain-containing protein
MLQRIRTSTRRAFTMLEVLTAVAISTIIVAGLYSLFTMQSRQFLYQDMQMAMHQNLRFASDVISRTGRMAGYGTGGTVYGALGYNGSISDSSSLPALIASDDWTNSASHDAVTFVYADPALEMMTAPLTIESSGTSSISFPMGRAGYSTLIQNYEAGDLMLCWDYANQGGTISYLWEISTAGDSGTGQVGITSNSGVYSDYDTVMGSTDNLPPVLHCSVGHVVTLYIDDTDNGVGPGSPAHPVLMMDMDFDFLDGTPDADDIPLVDDIENMQFRFCNDESDCTDDSSGWGNTMTTAQGTEAWMLRFYLTARSSKDDVRDIYQNLPIALANETVSTTEDSYWRQYIQSSVTMRNLRLQHRLDD